MNGTVRAGSALYNWHRAAWTVAVTAVAGAGIAQWIREPQADGISAPDSALFLSLVALPVLVRLDVPNRWLRGGFVAALAGKWARLLLLPLVLIAASGGLPWLADIIRRSEWLVPAGDTAWAMLIAAAGTCTWCALQWFSARPKLFFLLKKRRRIQLIVSEGFRHLLHNGLPEELFYRVLLQARLVALLDSVAAGVGLSSLIFGLIHMLWSDRRSWPRALCDALFIQIPLGVLLGVTWEATLWLPGIAVLHAVIDTVVTLDQGAMRLAFGPVRARTNHGR